MTIRTVRVWDIAVRTFHWLVVVFFFVSYLANEETHIVSTAVADDDEREHDNNGDKNELWEEIHEFLANLTLLLVFVHILGVLISSAIHQENLIKAMIAGNKMVSSE